MQALSHIAEKKNVMQLNETRIILIVIIRKTIIKHIAKINVTQISES